MSEKKDLTLEQIMQALEETKPSWMADGKGIRGDAPRYKPLEMPRGEISSRTGIPETKHPTPPDHIPPCVRLRAADLNYNPTDIVGCGCIDAGGGLWFSVVDLTFTGGPAVWDAALGLWVEVGSLIATYNAYHEEDCAGAVVDSFELGFSTFIQCLASEGKPKFRVLITGRYDFDGGAPSAPASWPSAELTVANSTGWIAFASDAGLPPVELETNIPNWVTCADSLGIGGGTVNIETTT